MFKSANTVIPNKHKQLVKFLNYSYSKSDLPLLQFRCTFTIIPYSFLYILLNIIFLYFLWYEYVYIFDRDEYCTIFFLHLRAIISRTFSPTMSGTRRDCDNFQSFGRAEGTQLDGSMTSNGWKGMLRMHVLICSPSRSESLRTEYSFLSRVSRGVSASKGKEKFFS